MQRKKEEMMKNIDASKGNMKELEEKLAKEKEEFEKKLREQQEEMERQRE